MYGSCYNVNIAWNASAKQLQNGWTEIVIGDLLADGMTLRGKNEKK